LHDVFWRQCDRGQSTAVPGSEYGQSEQSRGQGVAHTGVRARLLYLGAEHGALTGVRAGRSTGGQSENGSRKTGQSGSRKVGQPMGGDVGQQGLLPWGEARRSLWGQSKAIHPESEQGLLQSGVRAGRSTGGQSKDFYPGVTHGAHSGVRARRSTRSQSRAFFSLGSEHGQCGVRARPVPCYRGLEQGLLSWREARRSLWGQSKAIHPESEQGLL
jgi:hypothetical protein